MSDETSPPPVESHLDSWKAIAAYLNRDVRTVMRWEKSEGLPVHRHRHRARSTVYACREELDFWRASRRGESAATKPQAAATGRARLVAAIFAAGLASLAGGGPFSGPLAAEHADVVDRPLGWPDDASMKADASMSADGRFVSFIDQTTDELTIKDLQTGRERTLTQIHAAGGWMERSAISRDNRFVAFASKDAGPRFKTGKLRLLPLDAPHGAVSRVLAEGQWFEPQEWSPDNRQLLVRVERDDQTVDIGIVTIATGEYRMLKRFGRPFPGDAISWSADGRFIAFDRAVHPMRAEHDIFVLPTEGGEPTVLLDGPSSDTVAGWSPDGASLLFQSDRRGSSGLWALPMKGGRPYGDPRLVRSNLDAEIHTITARGDVFYERAVGAAGASAVTTLLTARVDPQAGTLLTAPWFAAHDRQTPSRLPRWSADGRQFMCVLFRPEGTVITIRSLDSGQVREIPLTLTYVWTFDWSPDARRLVFHGMDYYGREGIFLVDAASGNTTTLALKIDHTVGYVAPQFSPDGRSVACFRREADRSSHPGRTAYIAWNLATGSERPIYAELPDAFRELYPLGRSPDERFLLVIHEGRAKTPSTLLAFDTTTKRVQELLRATTSTAFNYEGGVQWMPDSRAVIANVRGPAKNQFDLWFIPLDGTTPHVIDAGVTNLANNAVAIHPDGHQVAYLAGDPVPSFASSPRREFRLLRHVWAGGSAGPTLAAIH